MDKESIHHGWLECLTDAAHSKSWMKLSMKKAWKRRYLVLYRLPGDPDKVLLSCYDKDEHWHRVDPKKTINLYPRYKIAKLSEFKGKENVLEVNNEQEQWYLSTEKSKILDLWASQIQMQTKLSRAISGRIFSVSGAVNKQMQKVGAAQQQCLLHFTRWGITLALQESRSILAMWPLKTIRNYESTGQCQFSIEAGRKSPMGEGQYLFNTNIGQDDEMFNVVDAFVAATLNEQAQLNPNKKGQVTDEEILKTYDQLHRSALGLNTEVRNPTQNAIDTPGYAHIGARSSTPVFSREALSIHKPPDYNRLFDDNETKRVAPENLSSENNLQGHETPRGLSFSDNNSYDQLDRKPSWGGKSVENYDHINQKTERRTKAQNAYDKIERSVSGNEAQNVPKRSQHFVGYPLRDEPSVPFLDDNEVPFQGRARAGFASSPLQQTPDDEKYEFRNSMYITTADINVGETYSNAEAASISSPELMYTNAEVGSVSSQDLIDLSSRHGSTASERSVFARGFKQRITSSSFHDKSIQDIADHFLYQMPSSFAAANDIQGMNKEAVLEGSTKNGYMDMGEMYENSVRDSVIVTKELGSSGHNVDSEKVQVPVSGVSET